MRIAQNLREEARFRDAMAATTGQPATNSNPHACMRCHVIFGGYETLNDSNLRRDLRVGVREKVMEYND